MKKVMLLAPETLCSILRDTLERRYILLPCCDSGKAQEILATEPDILILSLFLPGMDGLTFLRKNAPYLPPKRIALTTCFDEIILTELAALGISHVIRIPCSLPHLEQHL